MRSSRRSGCLTSRAGPCPHPRRTRTRQRGRLSAARPLPTTPLPASSALAAAAHAMTLAMRDNILDPSSERAHAAARCPHTACSNPATLFLWLNVGSGAGRKEQEPRRRVPRKTVLARVGVECRDGRRSVSLSGDVRQLVRPETPSLSLLESRRAACQRRTVNVPPSRSASFVSSDTHLGCHVHTWSAINRHADITRTGAHKPVDPPGSTRSSVHDHPSRAAP